MSNKVSAVAPTMFTFLEVTTALELMFPLAVILPVIFKSSVKDIPST